MVKGGRIFSGAAQGVVAGGGGVEAGSLRLVVVGLRLSGGNSIDRGGLVAASE
jgi:hypothetical protein